MGEIQVRVNGRKVRVRRGATAAAAVARAGAAFRRSRMGEARAPLCGMGICYECRVTIDGRAHTLSCQTICEQGMEIETG